METRPRCLLLYSSYKELRYSCNACTAFKKTILYTLLHGGCPTKSRLAVLANSCTSATNMRASKFLVTFELSQPTTCLFVHILYSAEYEEDSTAYCNQHIVVWLFPAISISTVIICLYLFNAAFFMSIVLRKLELILTKPNQILELGLFIVYRLISRTLHHPL